MILLLSAGVTGVGKSVISTAALDNMVESKGLIAHSVVFSAQTSALDTQFLLESKLEKKRKTRYDGSLDSYD
jgi:dynein heavy chain